jgi:3-mercaptopyruvate sulfurtransferase SseA
VVELKTKGIENAGALLGGFAAWQNAGLPVDTKETKSANP